jgi:MYXO-CTERM domain-containing protein
MPAFRHLLSAALITFTVSPVLLAQPQATPEWQSGFETGFPGEFTDYDDGSWSMDGEAMGRPEIWTIVGTEDPVVTAGEHAYKGFPSGPAASDVRRAYPVLHTDIPSPCVNSFLVYLDADFSQVGVEEWIHVATYANNPDWTVFTMSVRDSRLEMAHLDWSYVGPDPQPEFPLRRWVRITTYMEFNGDEALTHVWQDGVHIFEGVFTDSPGTSLMRAHWGWYSSAAWDEGVEYNDEIQIWSLSGPLTDFTSEPMSPYGMGGTGNGGGGTGATGGNGTGGTGNGGGGSSMGGSSGATGGGSGTNGGSSNGGSSNGGSSNGGSSNGGSSAGDGGSGTGDPAAAEDDGGCGCRTSRPEPSSAWLLIAAFGAGLIGRRRSRAAS